MKALLVGEAPSRTSDPALPFSGRSGERIENLMGRPLADVFDLRNLLDSWPGAASKGSRFDHDRARDRAIAITRDEWRPGRLLVMAGRRVARAFGMGTQPYLEVVGEEYPAVVFPHPSGVDRWWNDQANVARARALLLAIAVASDARSTVADVATDQGAVVRSFAALMQEGEDVTHSFLLAAIYARAIHEDKTPQQVAEDLFKLMPTGGTWRSQRRSLLEYIEEEGES